MLETTTTTTDPNYPGIRTTLPTPVEHILEVGIDEADPRGMIRPNTSVGAALEELAQLKAKEVGRKVDFLNAVDGPKAAEEALGSDLYAEGKSTNAFDQVGRLERPAGALAATGADIQVIEN